MNKSVSYFDISMDILSCCVLLLGPPKGQQGRDLKAQCGISCPVLCHVARATQGTTESKVAHMQKMILPLD